MWADVHLAFSLIPNGHVLPWLPVSRYIERREIEVGQVEPMFYIKPLQGKRCARWALSGSSGLVEVCGWAHFGSSGVWVGLSRGEGWVFSGRSGMWLGAYLEVTQPLNQQNLSLLLLCSP